MIKNNHHRHHYQVTKVNTNATNKFPQTDQSTNKHARAQKRSQNATFRTWLHLPPAPAWVALPRLPRIKTSALDPCLFVGLNSASLFPANQIFRTWNLPSRPNTRQPRDAKPKANPRAHSDNRWRSPVPTPFVFSDFDIFFSLVKLAISCKHSYFPEDFETRISQFLVLWDLHFLWLWELRFLIKRNPCFHTVGTRPPFCCANCISHTVRIALPHSVGTLASHPARIILSSIVGLLPILRNRNLSCRRRELLIVKVTVRNFLAL